MIQFTQAVRDSLESENWFSALFLTLALPDICGKIDNPEAGNGERYKKWFKDNMPKYTEGDGMFSEEHAWKFRCSCLHSGKNLELDKYVHFIEPPPNNNQIHLNSFDGVLQMQIDIFCEDVVAAIEKWWEGKDDDSFSFLQIYGVDSLEPYIVFK